MVRVAIAFAFAFMTSLTSVVNFAAAKLHWVLWKKRTPMLVL